MALLGLFTAVSMMHVAPATALGANSLALEATYEVQARVEFGSGRLHVDSTARVTNTTTRAVGSLSFNLAPLRLGRARVAEVSSAGVPLRHQLDDQTMSAWLTAALAPGASVDVRIVYSATFRTNTTDKNWYFGKVGGIVTSYRWIPWLSRPVPFDRPNIGSPFVTAVSPHVRVRFTSDRALTFATSGERTQASGSGQEFVARNVRDFSFSASPEYRVTTGRAGDVDVRVLSIRKPAKVMLKWARRALVHFAERVGPYPYDYFTVAETPPGASMESPAMVWIGQDAKGSRLRLLVVHETAHQWFYGIIGNDQADEPFADEAPTDFLTRDLLNARRKPRCPASRLDLTIYDYEGRCYHEVIYIQGGNYLDDYRQRVGDERFWAGMREYYRRYRFKIGGTHELLATLDDVAGATSGHEKRFGRYDWMPPRSIPPPVPHWPATPSIRGGAHRPL